MYIIILINIERSFIMSSIIKVTNKQGTHYKAIYDLPPLLNGKRRRTSKTFPVGTSLSVVKQFLAERELEYARGGNLSADYDITFSQFADMYFETYTQFLSPSTLINYKRAYNNKKSNGLKNYFGDVKLRKITSRNIQEYVNFLSAAVSPKSSKNYIMLLNVLFKTAIQLKKKQKGSNPVTDIIKPTQHRKQVEAYNLKEFNLLLHLAETDTNADIKLIIFLAVLSGIRRGEMAALKWEDVNFDEGFLNIHSCRIVLDKTEYIKSPKTDSGIRKIYIPDKLLQVLKQYHLRYLSSKLKYGKDFKDKNYVVSKPDGDPFTPQGISNNYARFMKRHKDEIRYLKFHGLRHTYASVLIEQGENPKTVQHNLGHADVALTLQVYSHSYDSAQQKAAKKLDETITELKESC